MSAGLLITLLAVAACSSNGAAPPAPASSSPPPVDRVSSAAAPPVATAGVTGLSPTPAPASTAASSPAPPAPPTPSLTGRTVVLNPGHNGGNAANAAAIGRPVPAGFGQTKECDTTGTNTNAGYTEHAFNWDVTARVQALLQARGVTVVLTRTDDTGVGPCVDARAAIGNQPGVAAVVSIHADGAGAAGHGFHICEDSRQPAGAAVAAQSHALTVALHDALVQGSGLTTSTYLGRSGYYPRDDLAGLNLATVPATFIELGNMRNAGDAALQTSPAGRAAMASAIAAGLIAWLSSS